MISISLCPHNHKVIPPRELCPRCRQITVETSISPAGRLITFTNIHVPPTGFSGVYSLALVKLDEGELVFCRGRELLPETILADGAEPRVIVEREGEIYFFRLV